MATTSNMGLTLPDVSVTLGPAWASQINSDLTLLDEHNHTSGSGVQVPVAGINFNDDLPLGGLYGVDDAKFLTLSASSSGATPTASLFRESGNLYYKNASGVAVRITNGASVDAPAGSGFTGLTSPAAAEYGGGVFELWQDNTLGSEIAGALSCGPIALQRAVAGAPVLTLTPSASMVSGYTLTFPSAPPAALSLLSINPSGVTAIATPDNTSIEISSGFLQVKPLGIDTAQLADTAVTTIKIDDGAVTQPKLGPAVFTLSASDSGAYSASTPTTPITEITALEIPSITLAASRPTLLMLQASQLSPLNNAYVRSQTNHTKLYFLVTEPGGGLTFVVGQVEVDTGAYFPPSTLSAWFIPSVSGAYKIEVFTAGVGGTSTFTMNYCRLSVFQA